MKLSCKFSLVNSYRLLSTLVLVWQGHGSCWNSHANSCLSTLMQLLFLFDQDTRVDETLMQTLACQLSCNSCSRLTRTRELMKLPCKLSLVNSHATLVLVWPRHESWWNSLMKLSCKILFPLRKLLDPIRKKFQSPELQKLKEQAYPVEKVKSRSITSWKPTIGAERFTVRVIVNIMCVEIIWQNQIEHRLKI